MRQLFFVLLLIIFSAMPDFLTAQISRGGIPVSFIKANKNLLNNNIPAVSLPLVDTEKLISEDAGNDQRKDIPWRFGENILVHINVIQSGIKEILPSGDKICRLRIYSKGALTLNLNFSNYRLPKGATLFIYNEDQTDIIGAFTDFNNRNNRIFATTLIRGESVVLEYFEPVAATFPGELEIDRVTHGYRNGFEYAKSFGGSGSCEINAACPQALPWENEARSVCMLVVNGNGFCSGALINNTSEDGTPYVLTAKHCSNNNNFSSWVFWFGWQSETCTNPSVSPSYNSISGCDLKARDDSSDFCLVQMSSVPPVSYDVFYAGWDRSGQTTPSAVCIHHPAGDIKKISFADNPTTGEDYSNINCWRAEWTAGATEPGSSGSPLFDINHRIIGQLYGGPSYCGAAAADLHDFYGKFSVSWDIGSSSTNRLKDWLDPGNTGYPLMNGFDPNIIPNDAQICRIIVPDVFYCTEQPVSPVVVLKNKGTNTLISVIVKYSIDNGSPVSLNWSGNLITGQTDTIQLSQVTLPAGTHIFKSFTSNPNSVADLNTYNDTAAVNFNVKGRELPFRESFEPPSFPPSGWSIYNPDANITWQRKPTGGGNGSFSAFIYLFMLPTLNQADALTTPVIDLSGSHAQLSFNVAYRQIDTGSTDTLKIFISTDCGATFDTIPIYNKQGSALATGDSVPFNVFTPFSAMDWRKDSVSLTAYNNQSIQLKFVVISGGGNNLYLDNVNIDYGAFIETTRYDGEFTVFPNPCNDELTIVSGSEKINRIEIFDVIGNTVFISNTSLFRALLNLKTLRNGIYLVRIYSASGGVTKKICVAK
ncbi:MAG: choice-of-anchor J domain-containing protein [Bacteroidetes bacterium]|nr:choice-of-anchor J domain-containing protein [Bacteroidota bacterium]